MNELQTQQIAIFLLITIMLVTFTINLINTVYKKRRGYFTLTVVLLLLLATLYELAHLLAPIMIMHH